MATQREKQFNTEKKTTIKFEDKTLGWTIVTSVNPHLELEPFYTYTNLEKCVHEIQVLAKHMKVLTKIQNGVAISFRPLANICSLKISSFVLRLKHELSCRLLKANIITGFQNTHIHLQCFFFYKLIVSPITIFVKNLLQTVHISTDNLYTIYKSVSGVGSH